jgi:hypothetical protein
MVMMIMMVMMMLDRRNACRDRDKVIATCLLYGSIVNSGQRYFTSFMLLTCSQWGPLARRSSQTKCPKSRLNGHHLIQGSYRPFC